MSEITFNELQIRKRIEEAKKEKYTAKQLEADVDIKIAEYELQLLHLNKNNEKEINECPTSYRHYPESCIKYAPMIIDVYSNGSLQLQKQKTTRYDIHTLIELKRKIPQIKRYPNFKSLSQAVGVEPNTCQRLCAGIELGMYDDIFKKWDNTQNPLYDRYGQLIC